MRIIIHFNKSSKIREFTQVQIIRLISVISLVFIGLLATIVSLLLNNSTAAISHENKRLKNTISELNKKLIETQSSLNKIYETERKLRLAAGLDLEQSYATGGEEEFELKLIIDAKENNDLKALTNLTNELINRVKFEQNKFEQLVEKFREKEELAKRIPAIVPMDGIFSNHSFGMRIHPILKRWKMHEGIDILGFYGNPVYSTGAGIVKFTGWNGGLGLTVIIDHGFGYETTYGHLSKIVVREGQKVNRFQKLGECGSTGLSTGPHLHYEVSFNGEKQNPVYYFIK